MVITDVKQDMQIPLKKGTSPSMSVRKELFCLVPQFIKLHGRALPSASTFVARVEDKCYHCGLTTGLMALHFLSGALLSSSQLFPLHSSH